MLIDTSSPTVRWLHRAADDPSARHPSHLPETLDLREHADLFLRTYEGALPGTELGFPLVLKDGRLTFPPEVAAHSRYDAFQHGGRFVGTFHAHPLDPEGHPAPFFDPGDLAAALRSDYPGFIELLLAGGRLFALVRANPYLYVSAHHVNRNPLLFAEQHEAMVRRRGSRAPDSPQYDEHFRKASLYFFDRYQLALYEGDPREPLKRTVTPEGTWRT